MASEVLVSISRDEAERARLLSEYKYVVDLQSKVVQAKREGKRDGEREGKREVARNLKAAGDPFDKIAHVTGLDIETVKRL
jgi:predicted transposase/invertase (TIGR01784 family)